MQNDSNVENTDNPNVIEIEGYQTIIKLCKFASEQGLEGCTWTEIIEKLLTESQKKLNAPARVGGAVFRENIDWKSVIECAQRHYGYGQETQPTPLISPQNAIKLAKGEVIIMPKVATQDQFRAFYDAFNSSKGGNTAQRFKDGYVAMTDLFQGENQ